MTIGTVVLLIAVLACPAIMWWMMRSHRSDKTGGTPDTPRREDGADAGEGRR